LRLKNKRPEEKLRLNEKRTSASNANGVKKSLDSGEKKKKPLDGELGLGKHQRKVRTS